LRVVVAVVFVMEVGAVVGAFDQEPFLLRLLHMQ